MRAAVYVRVSTEEQAKHGYSLAEQEAACSARARELGADQIEVHADEGISGGILERPALEKLREAVRAGAVDLIVVRDPDRLSRRLAHQLLLTDEFERYGVRLEFIDFEWKDSPEGRLFYSVRGAIAEFEKEKIRERMTRGKNQKARQGGIPVSFDCYGYQYDPETGQVSVLPAEAEVVEEIFRLFVEEDWGINGIARLLNEQAIPTRWRRGKWHRQVVRQILLNGSAYAGTWQYGKIDWHTRRKRDPKDWIPIAIPAIITPQAAAKAAEKLKEARRLWNKRGQHSYLLSGIITCADCGNPMTGVWARNWGVSSRCYTCRKNWQGAKSFGCRPSKIISAESLENAVWEQICSWLRDPDRLAKEAMASSPETPDLERQLEGIEKQLAETDRGRENILAALASGLFELDEKTTATLSELKKRREHLEARKKEIRDALKKTPSSIESLKLMALQVLARLDDLDFEQKRAIVRSLVKQVIITGKGKDMAVTVVSRIPGSSIISIPTRNV